MHHVLIKILQPGDTVLNVTADQIVVRRGSGEVELYRYLFEDGVPRIDPTRVTIAYGDGAIEVRQAAPERSAPRKGRKGSKSAASDDDDDDGIVTGSF